MITLWNPCGRRCLPLFVLVLLLGACSVKSPVIVDYNVEPLWQQRLAVLERLDVWSFEGRIAVRSDSKAWNAKLNWAQSGASYDILISAPFGQGAARLSGEPGRALIDVSGQPPLLADDPGTLLYEEVGWMVPVDALHYWLTGRPDPQVSAIVEWDGRGRVVRLAQNGWTVTYRRYNGVDAASEGVSLPTKVELVNHDLRVKIIIDRWQLNS